MLIDAATHACEFDYSVDTVQEVTGAVEQCKTAVHTLIEKIGAALAAVRGRNLDDIRSLGDANVYSFVLGLVADAQLLLEAVDVQLLPHPELHVELLANVRKTLCEAASICIKQQCAGNPEYSVPAECDCQNPQEWDFPSTSMEAVYSILVGDFVECRIM
ncbi:hypothetical protein O998_03535 [Anaplasma phagocytophilum str. Norway variant1]|uniref:Uncharacterized protein n=2 Tax=Anaplasma phagocytophilum TaxID=948 RepID=A0A7H9E0M3_ANAPH|nr:hypothetical protein O998_03535 [Anaplasma phagocytophilum str. Norway variant1]